MIETYVLHDWSNPELDQAVESNETELVVHIEQHRSGLSAAELDPFEAFREHRLHESVEREAAFADSLGSVELDLSCSGTDG